MPPIIGPLVPDRDKPERAPPPKFLGHTRDLGRGPGEVWVNVPAPEPPETPVEAKIWTPPEKAEAEELWTPHGPAYVGKALEAFHAKKAELEANPEPEELEALLFMMRVARPVNRKDLAQHMQTGHPGKNPKPKGSGQKNARDNAWKLLKRLCGKNWAAPHMTDPRRFVLTELGIRVLERNTIRTGQKILAQATAPGGIRPGAGAFDWPAGPGPKYPPGRV